MTGKALSMVEVKEKLLKLEELIPHDSSSGLLYYFGQFLAGRLNDQDQVVPEGFVMACELALYDLQTGVDGFKRKPIQHKLVGYPPIIYNLLRREIPRIADAVFPSEFATAVKDFIAKVTAEANAKARA